MIRYRILIAFLALPFPSIADNCSGYGDCFNTLQLALATAVGLALLSLLLDFLPGIGTAKGVVEAVTGEDIVTGQKLEKWERIVGVIPFGKVVGGIGVVARHGDEVLDLVKQSDSVADVSTLEANFMRFEGKEGIAHFNKHGTSIANALDEASYDFKKYIEDANFTIKNGIYIAQLNGYVRLIGGRGSAKFGFVGLSNAGENITTFHIKTVRELAKRAPDVFQY